MITQRSTNEAPVTLAAWGRSRRLGIATRNRIGKHAMSVHALIQNDTSDALQMHSSFIGTLVARTAELMAVKIDTGSFSAQDSLSVLKLGCVQILRSAGGRLSGQEDSQRNRFGEQTWRVRDECPKCASVFGNVFNHFLSVRQRYLPQASYFRR